MPGGRRVFVALACGLALVAYACGCVAPVTAMTVERAPPAILFVGNSFVFGTSEPLRSYADGAVRDENAQRFIGDWGRHWGTPYGGVAAIFKTFTTEANLPYDVHVELRGGASLRFHFEHALGIIARPGWSVVVLQEQSTAPLAHASGHEPSDFMRYTRLLERAIHRASPTAGVLLYETYPRADLTYPEGAPYAGRGIAAMGRALHDAYGRAAHAVRGTRIAPVGDAWLRAISDSVAAPNPYAPLEGKIDLWASDGYHPSAWGAYLAACVFFESITGRDARTLGPAERAAPQLGIAPAQARALQRVAHESLVSYANATSQRRASPATTMPVHGDVPSQ